MVPRFHPTSQVPGCGGRLEPNQRRGRWHAHGGTGGSVGETHGNRYTGYMCHVCMLFIYIIWTYMDIISVLPVIYILYKHRFIFINFANK